MQVRWTIADGTYLYHDKVRLELSGEGAQLGDFSLPEPEIKQDSIKPDGTIGDVAVYHGLIELDIPLRRTNTAATSAELTVRYQGCADRGICYPPQMQVFRLDLPAAAGAAPAANANAAAAMSQGSTSAPIKQSEQDRIVSMIDGKGTWVVVGAFFLIGLGLALTPCVFPMIPILSGIITGQGTHISTRKAFMLSLVYVLAMAFTYTLAGVLAALAGENLQATYSTPWRSASSPWCLLLWRYRCSASTTSSCHLDCSPG